MNDDNVLQFPGGQDGDSPQAPATASNVPPADTAQSSDAPSTSVEATGMSAEELHVAVEALLFASGEPLSVREIVAALPEVSADAVRTTLHELSERYATRGIRLVHVAGAWQMRTDPRCAELVARMRGGKPQRMSRAALETLAVVAYRQPATRHEIDELRGVGSGGVVKTLLERGYIRVTGRRDEPGRPLEYSTTDAFLEVFSLSGLDDLPTLKEREKLDEGSVPPAP